MERLKEVIKHATSMRVAVLSLGVVFLITGAAYFIVSLKYPIGTMAQPGPRVYMMLVSVLLFFPSLFIVIEAWLKIDTIGEIEWPRGSGAWRILQLVGGSVIFILLLRPAGIAITLGIFSLIILWALSDYRWISKISIAIVVASLSYILFIILLKIPLPSGFLFR